MAEDIFSPLNMTNTGFLTNQTGLFDNDFTGVEMRGEPYALSLVSSTRDLSLAGRGMLKSDIISPVLTRRWLKPITSTSNLRNAVGRPWEIYHYGNASTDPIIDIYTKTGSIGRYSVGDPS